MTRVLVLTPTRELALQCQSVLSRLARFTDIRSALVVGGLDSEAQQKELRTRPDVVIATPGRLIDHILNSPSFNLEGLDVLILDEADRLLGIYISQREKEREREKGRVESREGEVQTRVL